MVATHVNGVSDQAIADEFGGWNEEDHIRFTMIRHQYLRVNRPVSGPKVMHTLIL